MPMKMMSAMVVLFVLNIMVVLSLRLGRQDQQVHRRSVQFLTATPRIVNGKRANEYISYGFSAGPLLCGGTLIHDDIFLTAAHCEGVFLDGVVLGGTKIDGSDKRAEVAVDMEIPHSEYSSVTNRNDIMLVKLSQRVTSLPFQSLSTNAAEPNQGEVLTTMGYGLTSEGGSLSFYLQEVDLTVSEFSQCEALYGSILEENKQFCTYEPTKDTCQGDSGGPLLDSAGVQVGIISFGSGCARESTPAVNIRVANYDQWIRDGICEHSDYVSSDFCNATGEPSLRPTNPPTLEPASRPSTAPTTFPSNSVSLSPTDGPSLTPTLASSMLPTQKPSSLPTRKPSMMPLESSLSPSHEPSSAPMSPPTDLPSPMPTPKLSPTTARAITPAPTGAARPSKSPTSGPTMAPTETPTLLLTGSPTKAPTQSLTQVPTQGPTMAPSYIPTSQEPTRLPTTAPTRNPTKSPSLGPAKAPVSDRPTSLPTKASSPSPSKSPVRLSGTSSPSTTSSNSPVGKSEKRSTDKSESSEDEGSKGVEKKASNDDDDDDDDDGGSDKEKKQKSKKGKKRYFR